MGFIELSSIMSNDEFDIYADIDDINLGAKIKTLQDEVVKLQEQLSERDDQIAALQTQAKKMWDTNKRLMCNISCLMKTAKLEGARKDKMIADLRKEKEDIIFRRNKNIVNQRTEDKNNDNINSITRNKSQDKTQNDKNVVQNKNKEITYQDQEKECIERKVKRKLTVNNEDSSQHSKKMKIAEVPVYDPSSTLRASENINQINREETQKEDFTKMASTQDNENNGEHTETMTSVALHNNELQVVISKKDQNSKENLHISSKTSIKGKSDSSPSHKSSSNKSKRHERDETRYFSDKNCKDKYRHEKRSRSPTRKNYKHESRHRQPDNDRRSKDRRKSHEKTLYIDDKRKYDDRNDHNRQEAPRRESSKNSDKSAKSTRYHKQSASCENLKNKCLDNPLHKEKHSTADNHGKSEKNLLKKDSSKTQDPPEILNQNISMNKDLPPNFLSENYKSHSTYDIEYIDLYKNAEGNSVEVMPCVSEQKCLKTDAKCTNNLENNKSRAIDSSSLLDNIENNKILPPCHSQIANDSNDKMKKDKTESEKHELKQIVSGDDACLGSLSIDGTNTNLNSEQKISDILKSANKDNVSASETSHDDAKAAKVNIANNADNFKETFQDEISKQAADSPDSAQNVILRILGMSRSPQKKIDKTFVKKKCESVGKELEDNIQNTSDEPSSSQEKIAAPEEDKTNRVGNLHEDFDHEKSESVINSSMSAQNIISQLLGTSETPQKDLNNLIREKKSEATVNIVEEDSIKAIADEIEENSQVIRHSVDASETAKNDVISLNNDEQNNASLNETQSTSTNSADTSKTSLNDSGNAYTLSTGRSKYECIVDNRNCYTIKCKRVRRMKNS